MNLRRMTAFLLAVVVLCGVGARAALWQAKQEAKGMSAQATRFLTTLPDDQRAKAAMKFDAPSRVGWHFIPKPFEGPQARTGVTVKEMNLESRKAAFDLLQTGLSEAGLAKVQQVMTLEAIIAKIEGPMPNRPFTRDPEMYYFAVYGEPGKGRWSWRCEGHHVSMNFTLDGDKLISATPSFLGANPGEVKEGPHKGLRVLEQREDLARALLKSCDEAQRKVVLQAAKAPDDLRGGGAAQPDRDPAVGLKVAQLTEEQRRLFRLLLESYALTMAPDIAESWMSDLKQAGEDAVQFAWWGGEERGEGHYYRVQGPTFLIEYNNTQGNANHVHSMWRDMSGDFGVKFAGAQP